MNVPARISLVTLGVADVERATAFYESLGWPRSASSVEGSVTFIQTSGPVLGLFGWEALADDADVSPVGEGFRGTSLALNLTSPDEVDEVFAAFVAAGATPRTQPHEAFWGGYTSYVADPDGHLWEIAHNPHATFDDAGRLQIDPPAGD
jgi:catechol 2,3-dioxygenase-like lactoylglutathione lyase family enzyme